MQTRPFHVIWLLPWFLLLSSTFTRSHVYSGRVLNTWFSTSLQPQHWDRPNWWTWLCCCFLFFFLQYVFSRNRHEIVNCPGLQRDSVSHLYLFPLSKYCQLSQISWGLEGEELIMGKQHPLKFCRVIAQVNRQPFHFLRLLTVLFNALLQMSCLHLLNCTKSILFQIIDHSETFFFFFLFLIYIHLQKCNCK